MSILNLLKFHYYFDISLDYDSGYFWVALIILILIFFVSLIANSRLIKNKSMSGIKRKFFLNWVNLGLTVSSLGLIYLFFRYQSIPYLNWRLWPTLLVLWGLSRAVYLTYFKIKILPAKLLLKQKEKSGSYYFRKRKK